MATGQCCCSHLSILDGNVLAQKRLHLHKCSHYWARCRDASAALHHTPCLNGCLSMQQEVGQSQNWNTAVLHMLAHLEPPTP